MRTNLLLAGLASASLLCSHPAISQPSFSPTRPAAGFNVFTKSAVRFTAGDTHGPVATGGDAILAGNTVISMNYSGYYPNGFNDAANLGLVIGGRVWYNSGNQSQLNRGQLRIGDLAGTTLYQVNSTTTQTQVQLSPGAFNASPNIQSNSTMPLNSSTTANGLDFPVAFTAFRRYSSIINNYPTTHASSTAFNFVPVPRLAGGGSTTIDLAANKINYLNLTAAEFTAMETSGITYGFSKTLDSNTVVVFNIIASGTYNWSAAAFGGISDNSLGEGRFILYNFPGATRINITGGRSTIGSILAPDAAVYKTGGNNAAGTIIADTFSMEFGEVHYAPFAGLLPGSGTSLPVEDLALQGTTQDGTVRLDWKVQGATASTAISLERSTDGASFETRTLMSGQRAGIWTESVPVQATSLVYRLRATSTDGTTKFSPVWRANLSEHSLPVAISPNPFTDYIDLRSTGSLSWTLLDARGGTVDAGTCPAGCRISALSALPAGAYFLQTVNGGQRSTQQLIKR